MTQEQAKLNSTEYEKQYKDKVFLLKGSNRKVVVISVRAVRETDTENYYPECCAKVDVGGIISEPIDFFLGRYKPI